MDLHRTPQWICIGSWSLIHFIYHARWLLLVLAKFNFLSWSDAHGSFSVEWIVRFIVKSICKQFCSCWCACNIQIWFWLAFFSFCCFLWRSGLLECWIRSYVRGHWYGCSLYRKTLLPMKDNSTSSCSRTNIWQLSTYPRRRVLAFIPYGSSVLTEMERFVCCSCEKRGFPSFFVSKRAVHTNMTKSKMCKGGELKRVTVMTRPGDVIAGGSGGMGPCPLAPPQHQPPGIWQTYTCHISGKYLVYDKIMLYDKYIPGIYYWNIQCKIVNGIYQVYTKSNKGINRSYDDIQYILGIYLLKTFWDSDISVPVTLRYGHGIMIYQINTWFILGIYQGQTVTWQVPKCPRTFWVGIYQVYTVCRHMKGLYLYWTWSIVNIRCMLGM